MYQFNVNLTKMADERTVVENASEQMLRGLGPELGRRYEAYHRQTGNLYATGYALAAGAAWSALQSGRAKIQRTLSHTWRQAAQRLLYRRHNVMAARGKVMAGK